MSAINERISHAKVYMEPDLYAIAQKAADAEGGSLSAWLRKLVIAELIKKDKIDQAMLVRLASS